MSEGLCKYKDSLGKPGQGVHSYRILKGVFNAKGFALVDVGLTLVAGFVIGRMVYGSNLTLSQYTITTVALFVLGIVLHKLFCVKTSLNQLLFK